MNSSENSRLIDALKAVQKLYPDWRWGQLVANVATWAKGPDAGAVWDVTDAELLAAAEEHLKQKSGSANPSRKAG